MRKRDEQQEKVRKAQMEVARVEGMIQANLAQVKQSREEMKICDPLMMSHYDNFLQSLYQRDVELKEQKQAAIRFLREQMEILQEREQEVKVLEKHKEKKKEEYDEEQKYIEMKQLNEVGSLKHYARKLENEQEELEELIKLGIEPE